MVRGLSIHKKDGSGSGYKRNWTGKGDHIISLLPHLHTLFPPFSPSLISLVVSVDVKHHVYLLRGIIYPHVEKTRRLGQGGF